MKKFISRVLPLFMVAVCMCMVSACSSDDDDNGGSGGGLIGFWYYDNVNAFKEIETAVKNNYVENGLLLSNEPGRGYELEYPYYRFINSNTYEHSYCFVSVNSSSNAFAKKSISGRTVYFVPTDVYPVYSYTYVKDGNKLYSSDGTIFTYDGGNTLRKDGDAFGLIKGSN